MNDHGGNTGLDAVVERYVTPNRRYLKLFHGTVVRMDEAERWALAMLLALLNHFRLFALFRSVSRLGWTRFGSPGMPCIVIQVLQETLHNNPEGGAGSKYFREPLDLIVGVVDDDKELDLYHVDSRRFEPYDEAASPQIESAEPK